ncbi:otogelin [Denticeps clupeoides]|uniref:otogelin n=1 Tax=Denticeps clupeoides TaxID=299321 RepID=UPI0010A546D6|nr:otogelin [Denticeps clupeoides]
MDPHFRLGNNVVLLTFSLVFILIYQAHISGSTDTVNITNQQNVENSESSSIILQKWDTGSQGEQEGLTINTSTAIQEPVKPSVRRVTDLCTFSCLNGGHCAHPNSCNCSFYQATGVRCQTVPNTGFEREMTCRSWGQYNFETFDGLYFYYPGKCTYTLLRDCEDNTQSTILIQVHNDPGCRSSPYSCARSVSLFLPWEGEIRLQNFTVTFRGQNIELPHNIHDIEMERIAQYILVSQPHGFTLAWEGYTGSVYVKMSPEYVGRTCGMCGNFNADVQDDLKTSYGIVTEDVAMFGNSWMEEQPHHARCPMVPSTYPSPCDSQEPGMLLNIEEVCSALLKEPFNSCHEFVSPFSYMASCSNDLCLSSPSGDAVCQVFTEYARACAHADHPLHNWRTHMPACSVPCPPELQYNECITCCPESCNVERMCIDSKLQCLDGCYCPDDLIYEGGSCVQASDCPCEHRGMLYPPGQTIKEECNNCTCLGGVWNCTDYSCPGECSVTGDMYFQSFDGRVYTFPATCQYVLAKSRNSGKFTVTIQNAPCGPNLDGACIQSVNLVLDEDPRTEITMSHIGEVFIASQYRISLPYSDDIFHIQELSSMFLQVKTAQGLRLQYNWREFRLYLQVSEFWKEDTVGLCGTFNGNIQDDFLSPSGMIESTPQLFGNAWRISSACVPSLFLPQLDPCDTHHQAASYAVQMCDVLNQEIFSPCHEYLSPAPFHQQCRADTCKCGQPCLCSALAHYARQCRRFSVIVEFRTRVTECAIMCPKSMEYGMCVSSCQRRCQFLSVPHHCGEECEEGCVCPAGSFYDARTHSCVKKNECPCSFLGTDLSPGDIIMTSSGVQICQDGKIMSPSAFVNKTCPPGQWYHDCNNGRGKGVACEETCESHLLNLTCSAHEPCIPGCVCPPELLKHGDECFQPETCPCLWKGKEYFPGDKVMSPCHQCVCQHGTFQCVFHPCPSMCTVYGDRHYRTFDGLLYDYVGGCKAYLVKSSMDSVISVTAENVDCYETGVICRKSLMITIGRSFINFDDDSGNPNPLSVIDKRQNVYIWQAGYFTIVHAPVEDVTVLWDRKTTIHIQAGPRWQGKLTGLCGNFDLKTMNEMRNPENIDSATPQEFGNSWTAAEQCVNSPDIRHPCSVSPLREPFAKRRCSILLSEVFQVCHPVVDVTWFYMNCLADTCGCNRGGDCECFCTSVMVYAHQCCQQGVTVDWRSPSVCPYDCEYYNKVLGKGPFHLVTYRERNTVLTANRSSGLVVPRRRPTEDRHFLSLFMMTPGLTRARPHDTSLVSFEAMDRPNYFLKVGRGGHLRLSKFQASESFLDESTFMLHRDTWISGYDSLESFSQPGFFLHYMLSWFHLMKYDHSDGFRRATLFRLTGPSSEYQVGPRCQWRYDACVSPCFKTCSDPSGQTCVTILKVEGCIPVCPGDMVLDEVTHRCVHLEDCINAPVSLLPITSSSAPSSPAAVTSAAVLTTTTPSTEPVTLTSALIASSSPRALETSGTIATGTDQLAPAVTIASTPVPFPPSIATEITLPVTTVKTSGVQTYSPVITTEKTTPQVTSSFETPTSLLTEKTSPMSPTAVYWFTSSTARPVTVTSHFLTSTTRTVVPTSPAEEPTRAVTLPDLTETKHTTQFTTSPHYTTTTRSITPTASLLPSFPSTSTKPTPGSTTVEHVTSPAAETFVPFATADSPPTTHSVGVTTPAATPEHTAESTTLFITEKTTEKSHSTVHSSSAEPETSTTHVEELTTSASVTSPRWTTTVSLMSSSEQPVSTTSTPMPPLITHIITPTRPSKEETSTTTETKAYTTITSHPPVMLSTEKSTEYVTLDWTQPSSQPSTSQTSTIQPVFPELISSTLRPLERSPAQEDSLYTVSTTKVSMSAKTETITTTPSSETTTLRPAFSTASTSQPTSQRTTYWQTPPIPETAFIPTIERVTASPFTTTAASSSHIPSQTTRTTSEFTEKSTTTPKRPALTKSVLTTKALEATTETGVSTLSPTSTSTSVTFTGVTTHPVTQTTKIPRVTERFELSTTAQPSDWSALVYRPTTARTSTITTERATTRVTPTTRIPRTTTTLRETPRVTVSLSSPTATIKTTESPLTTFLSATTLTRSPSVPPPSPASEPVSVALTIRTSTTSNTTGYTTVSSETSLVTTTTVPGPSLTSTTPHTALLTESSTLPTAATEKVLTSSRVTLSSSTQPVEPSVTLATPEATPSVPTTPSPFPSTVPYFTEREHWASTEEESSVSPTAPHTRAETHTAVTTESTTLTAPSVRMCTPPFSEIIDECTKFICVGGQLVLFNKSQSCPYASTPPNCGLLGFAILVNGDKCCPKWDCPCRCSIFPDLNVITFDGNSVAVYKAASYVVTQLPNETISILVQECPASDTLLWNFSNLCLVALNITHKSQQVLINRLQRRLYVNSRYAKPRFKKYGFEILDTGNMYLIRTPAGLKIQWFHSTGMMVIETESYTSKLRTLGLCGCCDGNPANDLTLPNGTTLGAGEDPGIFIDSWQEPNTTSYISQSRRREVNCSTSDCSECLAMLRNRTFIACHAYVSPTTFCEVWVRDAEYVNNPCVALAAYVASCHKFNVCIDWRTPEYCPFMCPEELRYQACLPACTAQSCPSHEFDYDPEQCYGLSEGCVCPEGTLLHRPYSALCIPLSKCACTDSFGAPRALGEVWKASKDGCCMYRCENDTIVPVELNCTDVTQPTCQRAGEVTVSIADDRSCCPQKVCVCNQSLCDAAPPVCKYGEKLVSYFREDSCCPEYACECDPGRCEVDVPSCRDDQVLIATQADGSCCLAHICLCETCLDITPECQEGELMIVDTNSTDRCCPVYHCACELHRCPQVSCLLGMTLVPESVPGRCCPVQTCECACDKIPSPKCNLGETIQVDRSFQQDPENRCGCKRHKCVRDAVCVDEERGVMRPGQTLVEHSEQGVCYSTHCTRTLDPLTGFYHMRTSSTNCSAQCQPNQIYVPPKDLTTCCGVCRNISCLHQSENGSVALYKPGKTWVSDCIRYDCADTQSGPTLVSSFYSCPPFNETECVKVGGTIISYMDGCCKTCSGFSLFPFHVSPLKPTISTNCERGKEDGKSCQKVTVRMTIRKNDCRSNRPVNIVSCDGKCPSASIYNYNINTYARFCKCCREIGLQRRSVQLYCSGNSTWVSYSIQEPIDCSCQWS